MAVSVTTRSGKGTPLTQAELDANFTNLANGINTLSVNSISQGDSAVTVTDTGTDGKVVIKTEGTDRVTVNKDGNMSQRIGTTAADTSTSFSTGNGTNVVYIAPQLTSGSYNGCTATNDAAIYVGAGAQLWAGVHNGSAIKFGANAAMGITFYNNSATAAMTLDASSNLTVAGTISGTLSSATQTGITSLGTLASLSISGTTSTYLLNLINKDETAFQLRTYNGGTQNGNNPTVPAFIQGLYYNTTENASIKFWRGGSTTGGYLTFTTSDGTERMKLDADGILNIGKESSFTAATPGQTRYGLHFSGTTSNYATGITWSGFGSSSTTKATEAAAGIYVTGNGTDGTSMYLATTDVYATGSKTRLQINNKGAIGFGGANYGTDGQVLMSKGSGAVPIWTTYDSSALVSKGRVNAQTGNTDPATGLVMYQAYGDTSTTSWPTTYGNVLSMNGGAGSSQLCLGWSASSADNVAGNHAENYIRSQRDTANATWSPWTKILTENNTSLSSLATLSNNKYNADKAIYSSSGSPVPNYQFSPDDNQTNRMPGTLTLFDWEGVYVDSEGNTGADVYGTGNLVIDNSYWGDGKLRLTGNTIQITGNLDLDGNANTTPGVGIFAVIASQVNLPKTSVNGLLTATSKSFLIDHPTKPGKKLQYGSLEGPENGVYVRGRLKGEGVIELPEYWTKLVDPDSITVNLTSIGKHQKLYVQDIRDNKVYVANDGFFAGDINCFYTVYGERVDIEKLVVEY